MKSAIAAVALFLAAASTQSLTINTPSNVVECQPTLITWSGGQSPYYLSLLPGATPNGNALETFNTTSSTSITWIVNVASGTSVGLTLRDGTGSVAQSAPFTILAGSSSSCLNSTSVVPGPTGSTPSTGGATTAAASTGAAASGTSAASSSSSTGTSSKNGAAANVAQFGAAGVVGAALAALFM